MRILVLGVKEFPLGTSTDPIPSGGIETYWARYAEVLREDNSITILTRRFPETPSEEFVNGIHIVRIPWIPGKLLRTPTFALLSAVWLLLHAWNYDLVISNGPWSTFFAVITRPFHRRRILFIPHGIAHTQPNYPSWSRFFHRIVEKTAYLLSDAVLFFTKGEAGYYRSVLHVPVKAKTFIVPPIVDVPVVTEEEKRAIREELGVVGKKVIMFVGRLVKVKGVDILIRAFALINHPDAALVIVGDGPERKSLERIVSELGVSDRVIFTGWRDDAPKLVSVADVFVLPSLSEGLPQSLLEALAHGVPCIVSDIPPLRDLPVEYFRCGDIKSLSELLMRIDRGMLGKKGAISMSPRLFIAALQQLL